MEEEVKRHKFVAKDFVEAKHYDELKQECLLWQERAEAAHPMISAFWRRNPKAAEMMEVAANESPGENLQVAPTPQAIPVQISVASSANESGAGEIVLVLLSDGRIFRSADSWLTSGDARWMEVKGPWCP